MEGYLKSLPDGILLYKALLSSPATTVIRCQKSHFDKDSLLSIVRDSLVTKDFKVSFGPFPETIVIDSSMDHGIPEPVFKMVIVDLKTARSVLRGSDVYLPGILAFQQGINAKDPVSVFTDPTLSVKFGQIKHFPNTLKFLGNGIALFGRNELFTRNKIKSLSGIGISIIHRLQPQPTFKKDFSLLENYLMLQNLPSIVTSRILDPQPNDRVLDMCAGVGGKTTHLAQLAPDCQLIALDRNQNKLNLLLDKIQAWNIQNIRILKQDALYYKDGEFDRILLDPPCSGLGQRPLIDVGSLIKDNFSSFQKKLVQHAVTLLKHDGILVYSTCTLNSDENEHVVEWVMENCPEMRLEEIPVNLRLGSYGWHSNPALSQAVMRFLPHYHDTIGFFIAKFRKFKEFSK